LHVAHQLFLGTNQSFSGQRRTATNVPSGHRNLSDQGKANTAGVSDVAVCAPDQGRGPHQQTLSTSVWHPTQGARRVAVHDDHAFAKARARHSRRCRPASSPCPQGWPRIAAQQLLDLFHPGHTRRAATASEPGTTT
jgi:hypothetical protein